jgi:putative oxidoreductase
MDVVFLIARIIYAYLVLGSSVAHLTKSGEMGACRQQRHPCGEGPDTGHRRADPRRRPDGAPRHLGRPRVPAAGAVPARHGLPDAPVLEGDRADGKQMEMVHFNKDLALAGSALAFFWAFQNGVDFTITDGLFA